MQLDLSSGILIVGMVQGLFLSLSISLHKNGPIIANRFLVLLLLSFVLALFVHFLNITNLWKNYLHIYIASSSVIFLFGPAVYFYVRQLTHSNKRLSWWQLLHLAPVIINLLMFIPIFQLTPQEVIEGLEQGQSSSDQKLLLPITKILMVSIYTIVSLKMLYLHHSRIKQHFSDLQKISLIWLRNLLIGFLLFEVIFSVVMIFGIDLTQIPGKIDTLLSALLILLIFMTGFHGMQQPEIFRGLSKTDDDSKNTQQQSEQANGKYQSSNLNPEDYKSITATLTQLFEQQHIYLNRFLDLRTLADEAKMSPHQLSQFLNEQLNVSFYDYVNQYRINAAKSLLIKTDKAILDIALEVGFNNKATFNKSFKKYNHTTPSQYRAKNQ